MDERCAQQLCGGEQDDHRRHFICGVIEGFYGRPWTTEQRKELFRKLKKWGMDSYVYAPKDDYKHRAFWRELYTVEEADNLTSLITAAKEHGIVFYYALSPGLDMTYSSQKEIQILKRKLDQVSHFGCEAFALLFDDIESEMSKADKEVFQTFANAQVSVTNEIYTHLGSSKFLFCPTQYCATRAVPGIHDSEYLNTLGSKLNHDIDILWTGNKVISKTITLESIQQITEVLRRPPVIWDNLHANDYDQKRVFLGPYMGRSPELIPHLRGVMTNPNCEFYANTIAIHTLACWSQCNQDSKLDSAVSADIRLETENEELPVECCLAKNVYHPRVALKNAIEEWLPEFFVEKEAWGPISKPQPQIQTVMPIIPIIPSINTCMSLTTTTTTSTNTRTVPEVSTTQLQALADVCSTVSSTALTPISNPVMNSLVSPTKVITNDDILNPISTTIGTNIPKKIPISIVPVPIMEAKAVETNTDLPQIANSDDIETPTAKEMVSEPATSKNLELEDDVVIEEKVPTTVGVAVVDGVNMLEESSLSPLSTGANEPMECSSSINSQASAKEVTKLAAGNDDVVMGSANDLNSMHVESLTSSPISIAEMQEEIAVENKVPTINNNNNNHNNNRMTVEDLYLLCDLFFLPFEHGTRAVKLLNEFNWLKTNANVLLSRGTAAADANSTCTKPEVTEWLQRADNFSNLCAAVHQLLTKVASCENKEICHELYSYVWDTAGALSLLNAYIKWLHLGNFPQNIHSYTQGTYTWFSKGWKDTFMSGDQEPWVFRGGLIADLQRLMPVDSGNDLFIYRLPELPTTEYFTLRPYTALDETQVYRICTSSYLQRYVKLNEQMIELPDNVRDLIADSLIGALITLNPKLCIVAQDETNTVIGYAAAALDVNIFQRNLIMCWLPEMREKYPKTLVNEISGEALTLTHQTNQLVSNFVNKLHNYEHQCPDEMKNTFPAVLSIAVMSDMRTRDGGVAKRLLTVLFAALRANGCFGAHICISAKDIEEAQFYAKLGFAETYRDTITNELYFARRF